MEGSKDAGVLSVMSLAIWSSDRPTASLAAILAIGKPVALLASADERDTRGFISMIITCITPQLLVITRLSQDHTTCFYVRTLNVMEVLPKTRWQLRQGAFRSAWWAARLAVGGVDGHLDVGAAALDAHLADDGHRCVAQPLVLLVRQGLRSQVCKYSCPGTHTTSRSATVCPTS